MKTIVWDVDDVLNSLMQSWLEEWWRPAHPECRVSYSQIHENPPHRVLGIPESTYLSSLDEFRKSAGAQMQPNSAILCWLGEYGDSYRHIALTARPLPSTPHTAHWLFEHFGLYFRCFGVVPSRPAPGTPIYDRSKGGFLSWMRAGDFLVDDSPQNVSEAKELGLTGILYPQPWNGSTQSVRDVLETLTSGVAQS